MRDPNRICKRCLLAEAGEHDLLRSLAELRETLPDSEKTDDTEYASRLAVCGSCDRLYAGTCMECGCYVEFRALKARMHCPRPNGKW